MFHINCNTTKMLEDFELPSDTKIMACPFVFKDGEQYCEMKEDRPYLFRLMELLESKPFYVTKEKDVYFVEE